ncbi:carbohydrate ABC transporter permease [Microcella humidisoli]|uniref:Carbohydrate ABC transporter permease n=1 Tax=Microcella humidisoli TaxID=2963406 RepID=A0ABY5FZ52_9MICO|nr:carbohydrate ABC transporter permease [Microcella humidisoli]UTT63615.1 carbohydrate ABC transporter permease [Microcella humidisoli]
MNAKGRRSRLRATHVAVGGAVLAIVVLFFGAPFAFILLTASKGQAEAAEFSFGWPTEFLLLQNLGEVLTTRDGIVVRALINSTVITTLSVALIVLLSAMVAFVLSRRPGPATSAVTLIMYLALLVPPAIVPTIWVLQGTGLFKTLAGVILVQVAYGMPFSVLLFRAFMTTVPRELDEAALIDGATSWRLFWVIVFPLLRPVMVTVIVIQAIVVFNDFATPLYFLPGDANATAQLTLFNFRSQFFTSWNLLFANILVVTVPPLLAFIFFSRQIVAGMSSGAIK